jgi:hypothetical protein
VSGIKFFVELADQADAKLKEINEEALKEHRFYLEQMENNKQRGAPADVKLETGLKLVTIGTSRASIIAASFLVEGMVIDVLRIGEGWEQGAWGKTQDILRGLALVGPAVKLAGAGARVAAPALRNISGLWKAVDFNSRLGNCSWVAAARAIRLSGQRLFITVVDIAKAKGLGSIATDTQQVWNLSFYHGIFQKLGIVFRPVKLMEAAPVMPPYRVATWFELENAVRAAEGDLVMFGVVWGQGAHALVARWVNGAMQIIDRTGDVYRSVAQMPYNGIASALPTVDLIVIPNAAIVPTVNTVAATTPNFLNVIAVQVMPTVVTPLQNGKQ